MSELDDSAMMHLIARLVVNTHVHPAIEQVRVPAYKCLTLPDTGLAFALLQDRHGTSTGSNPACSELSGSCMVYTL